MASTVVEIEQELGIESDSPVASQMGGLSGIMSTMSGLMSKMGVPIPKDMKIPSEKEISGLLSGIINDPQTQSTIGNIMSDLSNCKDPQQMVSKLLTKMNNPALTDAVTLTARNCYAEATANASAKTEDGIVQPVAISPSDDVDGDEGDDGDDGDDGCEDEVW